ncbi:MAG: hypothetical protein JWO30_3446 [Fibrobacteres bacterium]|nr:hypothetical protein [Fibrobacterota bacterium]
MVLRFLYDTRAMRYVEHVQRNNPYVLVNQFVGLDAGQARNVLQYLEGKGLVQIEVTDVVQLKQNEKGLANDLQTKKFYRITATGEEFIEERKKEASIFRQKIESEASMNITNIGGVTVVGNNNIVNAKFGDTYEKLENFKKAVLSSNGLSTEEKINCSSDIETIQKQLSKTSPSKEIVRLAWSAIEASVVLHDFGSVVSELGKQIHGMFT